MDWNNFFNNYYVLAGIVGGILTIAVITWTVVRRGRPSKQEVYSIGVIVVVIIVALGVPAFLLSQRASQTAQSQSLKNTPTATVSTSTPVVTMTITDTPTPIATSSPTVTVVTSLPLLTLQTLCDATKTEDYQTQWNQFDLNYATGNWGNEQMYASDLTNRDSSHGGVANCTISDVMQNGTSARGTTTTTFNDSSTDTNTFLLKEENGNWKIIGIVGK